MIQLLLLSSYVLKSYVVKWLQGNNLALKIHYFKIHYIIAGVNLKISQNPHVFFSSCIVQIYNKMYNVILYRTFSGCKLYTNQSCVSECIVLKFDFYNHI